MDRYVAEQVTSVRRHRRPALATTIFAPLLLTLTPPAHCGPLVLEESAKINSPDPSYSFGGRVAIDGDFVIVTGSRVITSDGPPLIDQAAFLFQRQSNGSWAFVRTLVQTVQDPDLHLVDMAVAMDNGVAAVAADQIRVFERTAAGWVEASSPGRADSTDAEIDAGTILVSDGSCSWDAFAIRKNVAGQWVFVGRVVGVFKGCDDEFRGGDVDISGTSLIVANPGGENPEESRQAHIYEGPIGAWTRTVVTNPNGPTAPFSTPVTIENDIALVGGSATSGLFVFRRESPGLWTFHHILGAPDRLMNGRTRSIDLRAARAYVGYHDDSSRGTGAGSVGVFARNANGVFIQVAKLLASDAQPNFSLGLDVKISNRRIVASGNGAAYIFELPASLTQPSRLQDDFQDGNAATWTPVAGSAFSVASTPASLVYRQSSLAGDAASFLNNTDWTNQSIEADARPTAFATGGGRWFGLAVRRADASNFYYVTVRNTNVIELKRMLNGSFSTLAAAPMPVVLNRTYRVRLEAVGTWIRVFVDGRLLVEARDTSLTHGQAGLIMYKTSADFDNVIVSPNPALTILADDFESGLTSLWQPGGSSAWSLAGDGSTVFEQASVAGDANAVTGITTDDQIVQARAKATSFAPGGERWFGLMARRRDAGNYYYVTVRNNNTISLRRLVNGTITILDTAPLTVTTGTWYTLRLEAIGNSLRGYVNGRLLLEAVDTSFPRGRYGAVMYKTAARYDDVIAWQP